MTKRTASQFLSQDYPEIYGFYIQERRTGKKQKPIPIFIRKQWVRSFRGYEQPYFYDIRAISINKTISLDMLRRITLEEELSLRKQGFLKGFNLEKDAGEKILVSQTEALRLRKGLIKVEVRQGRTIVISEFRY